MRFPTYLVIVILLFGLYDLSAQALDRPESSDLDSLFEGIKFRNIGPFRGGRSVASCGVIGDDQTYYMGSTGGGIWKTSDAGITWKNISDGQLHTGSVGAIEVAPSDPNVIYVGMGEHPVRGVMTSHGDGMYKSVDAGKTWDHIGLPNSRHIAEIIIHPFNHDVVYVAVQGAVHGDSEDRGVYQTIDGGATWVKVLYVDATTGAADITMHPQRSDILYASMWDHRRYPWQVRSGGPGSGIYQSTDAGASWSKVEGGLPSEMGKSAITYSPANPDVMYVNVESKGTKGGVYRSNNGGKSWKQTTSDRVTVARAWYYIEIFADPEDTETVYVLNAPMLKSTDGGKTFKPVSNPHGDQHHLWINPDNPENIILSNDGGACITFNRGASWSSQSNQPTIQFYRVITDNLFPYNIYGGQQDNSSLITASRTTGAGITWKDWESGPGCESAFLAFDPNNPQKIYGGCYQGNISVMDRTTREEVDIMAYPVAGLGWTPSDMKYRFNWNAPIVASPQDPNTIYHCGNHVLVTKDGGETWSELSPDLTRNDKAKQVVGGAPYTNEGAGGEVYNTISYLEASQHSDQVLWAGSDCGLIHVTTDGGAKWSNVTPENLGESLINSIDVSPHNPAVAYAAVTKYKFNDMSPMIYHTADYGKTWSKIVNGIDNNHMIRVVREDERIEGLLYAGSESGLYISNNNGAQWHKMNLNLPVCPITDLTFRDNDLIVATSGRSFWVLDDLSAIQKGYNIQADQGLHIYQPKESYRVRGSGRSRPGTTMGQNPASGVIIDYYIPSDASDSLTLDLEIYNKDDELMASYSSKVDKGFKSYPGGPSKPAVLPMKKGSVNRFNWNMRKDPITGVSGVFLLGGYSGPMVPPGTYKLKLSLGDEVSHTMAVLKADPRLDATQSDYEAQYQAITEAELIVKNIQKDVAKMRAVKKDVASVQGLIEGREEYAHIDSLANQVTDEIDEWESGLIQPDQKTFQDVINFPNKLNAEVNNLMGRMGGMEPVITNGMKQRLKDLQDQYEAVEKEKERIISQELKAFNHAFKNANVDILTYPED